MNSKDLLLAKIKSELSPDDVRLFDLDDLRTWLEGFADEHDLPMARVRPLLSDLKRYRSEARADYETRAKNAAMRATEMVLSRITQHAMTDDPESFVQLASSKREARDWLLRQEEGIRDEVLERVSTIDRVDSEDVAFTAQQKARMREKALSFFDVLWALCKEAEREWIRAGRP